LIATEERYTLEPDEQCNSTEKTGINKLVENFLEKLPESFEGDH